MKLKLVSSLDLETTKSVLVRAETGFENIQNVTSDKHKTFEKFIQ